MDASTSDPRTAASLVARLDLEEKVALLSGSDTWHTTPIERLGIPALKVSDGPNGVRGDGSGTRAVCLPAAIALGASFDVDLVSSLGRLLGRECVRKGAGVLLAPTINLARHPLGGRNFESFGEEPHLTGPLAVAYIEGVQDQGVGACAKHFVANDVEEARMTVSSEIDQATLREVYLAPFERVVEAGAWSLMAAYPRLNGEHCTEHHWLLTTLLRDEWGFDGLVMSDWGATNGPRSVAAGMDLEMPGPARALGDQLLAAVGEGWVGLHAVDRAATAVVDLAVRAGRIGRDEEPERAVDDPDERELVRRAAADGMVLLTNRPSGPGQGGEAGRPVLPLDAAVRTVAVVGPNADPGEIQGGGSAELPAHHVVSPVAGLADRLGPASVTHHRGCPADRYVPQPDPWRWRPLDGAPAGRPIAVELFDLPEPVGEPVHRQWSGGIGAFHQGAVHPLLPGADRWSQRWTGRLSITETGSHRVGVLGVGPCRVLVDGRLVADNWSDPRPGHAFFEHASDEVVATVDAVAGTEVEVVVEWSGGENDTLAGLRFGWEPPTDEDRMLDEAVAAAAGADAAVVVVGLTAEWETESHDRPLFGLPGRQDELVRRVAAANPRTVVVVNAGGPVDLPWVDEVPAIVVAWYPGQEFGSALADVLVGDRDPGGRLPVTFPARLDRTPTADSVPGDGHRLHYREGLFVGHRWYRREGEEPRFPFGHGLSYTSFELGHPVVEAGPGPTSTPVVAVPVTNIGDRDGKCVVQAYLRPDDVDRPRVLAGFAVARPSPGATVTAAIALDHQALRRWDAGASRWRPLSGEHRVEVATSSADVADTVVVTIPEG